MKRNDALSLSHNPTNRNTLCCGQQQNLSTEVVSAYGCGGPTLNVHDSRPPDHQREQMLSFGPSHGSQMNVRGLFNILHTPRAADVAPGNLRHTNKISVLDPQP